MNTLHAFTSVVASHDNHHGPWFLPFGLLWLVLLGAVIWLLVRRCRPRPAGGIDQARDILAERYARGELTAEEYRERLEVLG